MAGAMFLFCGATVERKALSILAPLLALVLSDIVVIQVVHGGHHSWFDPFTWLAFASMGVVGWTLRTGLSPMRLSVASLTDA
jgi:hypothetical protein